MSLPLEGLLVADFSQVLAGPLAATMLADLGASSSGRAPTGR
jgi:formyl-CoA transferase